MKYITSYCLIRTDSKLFFTFFRIGIYFRILETESGQVSNGSVLILIFDCFHKQILEVFTDFKTSPAYTALFSLKCHFRQRHNNTISRNMMLKWGNVSEMKR